MNRQALGLISLSLLLVGGLAIFRGPVGGSAAGFAGPCIKAGLVLGALWLALPQITRFFAGIPRWLLAAGAVAVVMCVINPWLLMLAIPALPALWFLGPKFLGNANKLPTPPGKALVEAKRPRRRSQV